MASVVICHMESLLALNILSYLRIYSQMELVPVTYDILVSNLR